MSKCSTIECVPLIISYHIYFLRFSKVWSTVQKMKFFIKDFFSKCNQICRKQQIWSHLLKKSLMENFFFCAVEHIRSRVSGSEFRGTNAALCLHIPLWLFFACLFFYFLSKKLCFYHFYFTF